MLCVGLPSWELANQLVGCGGPFVAFLGSVQTTTFFVNSGGFTSSFLVRVLFASFFLPYHAGRTLQVSGELKWREQTFLPCSQFLGDGILALTNEQEGGSGCTLRLFTSCKPGCKPGTQRIPLHMGGSFVVGLFFFF